jgi:hypothetical protein
MNSLSMDKAIHSTFPDPDAAAQHLSDVGLSSCHVDHALHTLRAFQRDTINTLAACLVNCAARLEAINHFVTPEDLKREAQALRDYADTLTPTSLEVNR